MPVIINGTTGISGVDGTAASPAIEGGDTNTGMFFPAADTIAFATNGAEELRIGPAGQIGIAGANYGTANQVLASTGSSSSPVWANLGDLSGVSLLNTQTFDSSGTWSKTGIPATAKFVIAEAWGAGGSGGKAAAGDAAGGGGGGSYENAFFEYASLGATESVTIGAGGASRSTVTSGASGGSSSFSTLSAGGGGGGGTSTTTASGGSGGSAGAITAPDERQILQVPTINIATGSISVKYALVAPVSPTIDAVTGGAGGGGSRGPSGGGSNGGNGGKAAGGGGGVGFQTGTEGAGYLRGTGGTSTLGGAGGAGGATASTSGVAGTAPGGGGGATTGATSGAGASGRVVVYTYG